MRSVSRHSFPGDNTYRIHSQLKASNTIYTFERHSKNVLEFAEGSWMFCWNPASAFLRLIIKTQSFIVASVKAADFQACLLSNCTWWQKKQTLFASFFFFLFFSGHSFKAAVEEEGGLSPSQGSSSFTCHDGFRAAEVWTLCLFCFCPSLSNSTPLGSS